MPLDLPQPSTTKVPTYVGTQVTVTSADPTGATSSSAAFEEASAQVVANGGGTLIVPAGTYQIGRQVSGLNGLYFDGVPSINISGCTSKVVIDIRGVSFKTAAGLKFGGFDPDTGLPKDITTFAAGAYPHSATSYGASLAQMILISHNVEVEVWGSGPAGTLFDGNINNITIGGLFHGAGDGGRALAHYGFSAESNDSFSFFNGATGKHFCTDALTVRWQGMHDALTQKYHYIENFDCIENGRLGLSWVGGNHLALVWCRSERNAVASLTNNITSVPVSGMDIENETDSGSEFSLSGGVFTRCIFSDNYGAGLITDSGQSRRSVTLNYCTFDAGHGATSVVPSARYWVFNHCLLVGAFNGMLTQADMIANGGAGIPAEAAVFNDCIFDIHASASLAGLTHEWGDAGAVPGTNTFGAVPQVYIAGPWPKFTRCTFNIDSNALQPNEDATTAIFTDCVFNGSQGGYPIWGIFNGTNDINYTNPVPGYGTVVQNLVHAVNNGVIRVNGITVLSATSGVSAGAGMATGAVTAASEPHLLSGSAPGSGAAAGAATGDTTGALGGRVAGRSFAAGAELLTGVGAGGAGYFPAVAAARLAGSVVRCDLLVFFDFATTPMRLWQGFGTLHTLDGHDWQGIGQLGQVGELESAIGGSAPQTTFTLSGVDPGLIATTLDASDEVKGRAVDVGLQFFNDDFQPLDVPYVVWSGLMDVLRVRQSGPVQCTIELSAETIFAKRAFAPLGSLSDQDQQRLFPGDVGLSLVPQMVSKSTIWPVIPPQ